MHIKSLKVQGFKSYHAESTTTFSNGLNLLVGRNGSGKSNFFSAIRFVLGDSYTSLSRDERQALLHDGSTGVGAAGGGATLSAFVEIEFDNEDGRFPTNKPTLLLRRTIGQKKDEYQLDRKSTTKSEVLSILEAAGFSKSNPYYIVPQGRITHLTNQKDGDRLVLLKEVAGTKVYEERRSESMKIMTETDAKRQKISDLLDFINDRLTELEEEREELKEFQVHDRTRRSLEYAIYQRELKEVGEALEQIEEDRRVDIDTSNTRRAAFNLLQSEINQLQTTIEEFRQRLEILGIENRELALERREKVKLKSKGELGVRDAEEGGKTTELRLLTLSSALAALNDEIKSTETSITTLQPLLSAKLEEETTLQTSISTSSTTLRTLEAKQTRSSQFSTQALRDAHLRAEIARHQALTLVRERQETEDRRALEMAREELVEAGERRRGSRKEVETRRESMGRLAKERVALKDQQSALFEQRKDLWKSQSKLESTYHHALDSFKAAERGLGSNMDKATATGLRAAKAIAQRLELDGYYGPVYDLFTVEERYKVAVEVTAGNSLFHIVVDTDETAGKILDIMIKEKLGRVTMIPLNRTKVTTPNYPNSKEAIPMINKMNFSQTFAPAFQQIFGRTIICQTLETAGAYTRSHELNSITLEGDKYDRKGSITGGYHDVRNSRLDAVKNLKNWEKKMEEGALETREIKTGLEKLDQEITMLVSQLQICEGKLVRLEQEGESIVREAMSAQREEESLKTRIERFEGVVGGQQSSIENIKEEIKAYEAELKTKMAQSLSATEMKKMESLRTSIEEKQRELSLVSNERAELASKKSILEIELEENLGRRRLELQAEIDACQLGSAGGRAGEEERLGEQEIAVRKSKLVDLGHAIEDLSRKLEENVTEAESLQSQILSLTKDSDKKSTQQTEDSRYISQQQKSVERYLGKRVLLMTRKDECNKNIRDLGVLPGEAYVETSASTEKLMKKLHKANDALKAFTHVNKKATEQYTTFTKQRSDLLLRRDELDASAVSIEELIDVLDLRKDEAIERTFKMVSKYFGEVFEKLVPAGRGRLVMQRRQEEEEDEEEPVAEEAEPASDEEETTQGQKRKKKSTSIESYTGVAIRVSFNSKHNEGLKIQQLSGGQKALVALAMIFAIQKCDPAPFYLFDEIDANLDADRRTGVAAMIKELSTTGQYICTTFRPELIPHAQSYFGVFFDARKISTTREITEEECLGFVEASEARPGAVQQQGEEGGGR